MATLINVTFEHVDRDVFGQEVLRRDMLNDYVDEIVTGKLVDKLIGKVVRNARDKHDFSSAVMFDFDDCTSEVVWATPSLSVENKLMWRHQELDNRSDAPVEIKAAQFKRYIKKRIGIYPN